MIEDYRPKPSPEASRSREAAGENSSQPHGGFRRILWKFKKNVTRKVSKRLKRSRHQPPAVQNVTHDGALSNQIIEDASCLHPSDDEKLENPNGCVNQGVPGEVSEIHAASSGVEEILGPQLIDAKLRDASEHTESMRLLEGHVQSVASAAKDGPQDLDAADDFQATYLQPLKISDTVTHESALSNQSFEHASHLHPSNPSGCVNQAAPKEVSEAQVQATSSGAEDILGPQLVDTGLRDARLSACVNQAAPREISKIQAVSSGAGDIFGPQLVDTGLRDERLSACVNQEAPREVSKIQAVSSGTEEILGPQLVDTGLQDVCEHTERISRPVEGHAQIQAVSSGTEEILGPKLVDTGLRDARPSSCVIQAAPREISMIQAVSSGAEDIFGPQLVDTGLRDVRPSACMNQEVPREVSKIQAASSGVEEILGPRLVDSGFRDVREHTENISRPVERRVQSVASEAARLQPLIISDTVIKNLAKVQSERREEERIQEKLRNLGVCVAGYQWIKQSSGYYRCAGGSHYVHESELR